MPKIVAFVIAVILLPLCVEAQNLPRPPHPWETYFYIEGKAWGCMAGEKARKFEEYLSIGWTLQPTDAFTVEAGFNVLKPNEHRVKAVWREIGKLGGTRIRRLDYFVDGKPLPYEATLLLADRNDGLFQPLMKWNGEMPDPVVVRNGAIIAIRKVFSGSLPTSIFRVSGGDGALRWKKD